MSHLFCANQLIEIMRYLMVKLSCHMPEFLLYAAVYFCQPSDVFRPSALRCVALRCQILWLGGMPTLRLLTESSSSSFVHPRSPRADGQNTQSSGMFGFHLWWFWGCAVVKAFLVAIRTGRKSRSGCTTLMAACNGAC